ncbi:MAG: hypothetical protein HQK49_09475 [Oligoflexia bacterium]|nr:hypothetical protein [Oligoflexia bacterium]
MNDVTKNTKTNKNTKILLGCYLFIFVLVQIFSLMICFNENLFASEEGNVDPIKKSIIDLSKIIQKSSKEIEDKFDNEMNKLHEKIFQNEERITEIEQKIKRIKEDRPNFVRGLVNVAEDALSDLTSIVDSIKSNIDEYRSSKDIISAEKVYIDNYKRDIVEKKKELANIKKIRESIQKMNTNVEELEKLAYFVLAEGFKVGEETRLNVSFIARKILAYQLLNSEEKNILKNHIKKLIHPEYFDIDKIRNIFALKNKNPKKAFVDYIERYNQENNSQLYSVDTFAALTSADRINFFNQFLIKLDKNEEDFDLSIVEKINNNNYKKVFSALDDKTISVETVKMLAGFSNDNQIPMEAFKLYMKAKKDNKSLPVSVAETLSYFTNEYQLQMLKLYQKNDKSVSVDNLNNALRFSNQNQVDFMKKNMKENLGIELDKILSINSVETGKKSYQTKSFSFLGKALAKNENHLGLGDISNDDLLAFSLKFDNRSKYHFLKTLSDFMPELVEQKFFKEFKLNDNPLKLENQIRFLKDIQKNKNKFIDIEETQNDYDTSKFKNILEIAQYYDENMSSFAKEALAILFENKNKQILNDSNARHILKIKSNHQLDFFKDIVDQYNKLQNEDEKMRHLDLSVVADVIDSKWKQVHTFLNKYSLNRSTNLEKIDPENILTILKNVVSDSSGNAQRALEIFIRTIDDRKKIVDRRVVNDLLVLSTIKSSTQVEALETCLSFIPANSAIDIAGILKLTSPIQYNFYKRNLEEKLNIPVEAIAKIGNENQIESFNYFKLFVKNQNAIKIPLKSNTDAMDAAILIKEKKALSVIKSLVSSEPQILTKEFMENIGENGEMANKMLEIISEAKKRNIPLDQNILSKDFSKYFSKDMNKYAMDAFFETLDKKNGNISNLFEVLKLINSPSSLNLYRAIIANIAKLKQIYKNANIVDEIASILSDKDFIADEDKMKSFISLLGKENISNSQFEIEMAEITWSKLFKDLSKKKVDLNEKPICKKKNDSLFGLSYFANFNYDNDWTDKDEMNSRSVQNDFSGLVNLGNTCFANASIKLLTQMVYLNPELYQSLLPSNRKLKKFKGEKDEYFNNRKLLQSRLAVLLGSIIKGMPTDKVRENNKLFLLQLKKVLKEQNMFFEIEGVSEIMKDQMDAADFVSRIFEILQMEDTSVAISQSSILERPNGCEVYFVSANSIKDVLANKSIMKNVDISASVLVMTKEDISLITKREDKKGKAAVEGFKVMSISTYQKMPSESIFKKFPYQPNGDAIVAKQINKKECAEIHLNKRLLLTPNRYKLKDIQTIKTPIISVDLASQSTNGYKNIEESFNVLSSIDIKEIRSNKKEDGVDDEITKVKGPIRFAQVFTSVPRTLIVNEKRFVATDDYGSKNKIYKDLIVDINKPLKIKIYKKGCYYNVMDTIPKTKKETPAIVYIKEEDKTKQGMNKTVISECIFEKEGVVCHELESSKMDGNFLQNLKNKNANKNANASTNAKQLLDEGMCNSIKSARTSEYDIGKMNETVTLDGVAEMLPVAVVIHSGGLDGGHYFSYLKEVDSGSKEDVSSENNWIEHNDSSKHQVSKSEVQNMINKNAYIILYQLKEYRLTSEDVLKDSPGVLKESSNDKESKKDTINKM